MSICVCVTRILGLLLFSMVGPLMAGASPQGQSTTQGSTHGIIYAQSGQDLPTLCNSLAAAPGTVVISTSITVPANTVIPPNCAVRVESGGRISTGAAGQLTINGPFEAGAYAVFAGPGTVSFGNNSVDGIRPQWFGALGNGSSDDSPAFQRAINSAAISQTKVVRLAPANYLLSEPIDVTTSSASNHSGISVTAEGRRTGVVIFANTGGILFDLTGSAWTSWKGLYILNGSSKPSDVAFLVAGTQTNPEAHYHVFEQITIQLYQASFSSSYGTVGFMLVGSEENTFLTDQVYATTPMLITTSYGAVSGSYPGSFQSANIQATHSAGANTFSGENCFVTFDAKSANLVLYGANSIDLGNMYFGNINIGAAGKISTAIRVLGGTLESFHARVKLESKNTLLEVFAAQLYGWDVETSLGGGETATSPLVLFHTDGLANMLVENFKLAVNYYDPAQSLFAAKPIFGTTGAATPALAPSVSNVSVTVNQTAAEFAGAPWPGWFIGETTNARLELVDATSTLDNFTLTRTVPGQIALGPANSTKPVRIGTIHLPPVVKGFNAQALVVRLTGLVSLLNPGAGGSETLVASAPVDTSRGAVSSADGAIVAAAGSSDNRLGSIAASSVSLNAGLISLQGVNLGLTYNSNDRTLAVTAYPMATGASTGALSVWLSNAKIELSYAGRPQLETYIGN